MRILGTLVCTLLVPHTMYSAELTHQMITKLNNIITSTKPYNLHIGSAAKEDLYAINIRDIEEWCTKVQYLPYNINLITNPVGQAQPRPGINVNIIKQAEVYLSSLRQYDYNQACNLVQTKRDMFAPSVDRKRVRRRENLGRSFYKILKKNNLVILMWACLEHTVLEDNLRNLKFRSLARRLTIITHKKYNGQILEKYNQDILAALGMARYAYFSNNPGLYGACIAMLQHIVLFDYKNI
ncbi:hypothetical protein KG892_04535 [Vermiphilus pyriformis]|nr:MAG: hypothetical protein KG892_04535 [Vermiphilus pyriformis]